MPQLLIVTDALTPAEKGWGIHPLLDPWRKQLLRCSRSWFECGPKTALEWYAAVSELAPADIPVTVVKEQLPDSVQQVWIASPYHAKLIRDQIRVMPDSLLPWSEQDARWICELLNPLLREEGITLLHHRAALLLACESPINARPDSFAVVSGKMLPNRHPDGADGGRLMRLMAEIQMVLSLQPAQHRRASGEPDIHGLWIWGGREMRHETAEPEPLAVATRNPLLMSLVDGKDASLVITDAEQLLQLTQAQQPLPKQVVLAGDGEAVVLNASLIPRIGRTAWQPESPGPEIELIHLLRGMI
ncbi:MAG: threonine synthase [Mariprofundaceae bacterium]|nr:threonine synthase [Mariprofundaceae bacterium]